MRAFLVSVLCLLLLPASAQARHKHKQHNRRAMLIAKQMKENRAAYKYHYSRIKNLAQLEKFIKKKWLVLISDTDAYYLDGDIGKWDAEHKDLYHYARQNVKDFLDKELGYCHQQTGDVYKINALVRTYAYQKTLRARDPDAGAIMGKVWWKQSLHLTGSAVDISWQGLSAAGRICLYDRLQTLDKKGKIIELRESSHYHVMVLRSYK